ncbi:MAG: chemotaxis protein CheX [Bryobacterales bacterium]|nr:chemotaxis protein CheX [Bryobacterales bacterium]
MSSTLQATDLEQIVEGVFETMLGIRLECTDLPWFPDPDRLTATVHFAGESPGAVVIECSSSTACRLAAALTGIDHREADEDVYDGLAEIVNMVGGNLKSLLHAGCGLSMPTVVNGFDYRQRLPRARISTRSAFECDWGEVWVTYLLEEKSTRLLRL